MNRAIIIGRLTRDPEVRYTDGGLSIAKTTVAVDRKFKKDGAEQVADFIPCTAFGKTAEFIEKYFAKGSKIVVEGRIQTGSYTNQDGQKIYTTDIIVEQVEFGESKASAINNSGYQAGARPIPSEADSDGFMSIPDSIQEELPFN